MAQRSAAWIWFALTVAVVLLVCMSSDWPVDGLGVNAARNVRQGQLQNMYAAQRKQREARHVGKGVPKAAPGQIPLQEEEHGEWIIESVSLRPPFPFGRTFSLPGFEYTGAAVVTDNYVRLTPDRQNKAGAVWSKSTLGAADWEVMFEFSISGQGAVVFGEGMAFWLVHDSDKTTQPTCFGGPCRWDGLAVFIDTYDNNGDGMQPSLTAVWNEGSVTFDHDQDGANHPGTLGSCRLNQPVRNRDKPLRLVVTYSSVPKLLETRIRFADGTWQKCVETELANPTTDGVYVGASAQTGQIADNHDLISIKAFDLTEHNRKQQATHGFLAASHHHFELDMQDDDLDDGMSGSSFLSVFLWIVVVLVAVAVLVAAALFFRKHQEKKRRAESPFGALGRRGFT